jgi:hypothetical protein
VAGTCECGNEPLGSINCRVSFEWLIIVYLIKKDSTPCSRMIIYDDVIPNQVHHSGQGLLKSCSFFLIFSKISLKPVTK